MSNDLKLWLIRIGIFAGVLIDGTILFRAISEGLQATSGGDSRKGLYVSLFFVVAIILLLLGLLHHKYKQKRWEGLSEADRQKVAVETLTSLSRQQAQDKRGNRPGPPPS
jgi:hypothetical protein